MSKELTHAPSRGPRTQRGTAGKAAVHAYALRESGLHAIPDAEAIHELNASKAEGPGSPRIWIDIICPGATEEALMRNQFGLHPLAVEDCMRGRQRPKLDFYPGYLFVVAYAAQLNVERHRTALEELHVFVGERWVITVHDRETRMVSEVIARWRANPNNFTSTGGLAHAL